MTYLQFVSEIENNPSLKTYSSKNLARKLDIEIEEVIEFREWYKAKTPIGTPSSAIQPGGFIHKEILDSIPSIEELEKVDFKVDPRLPKPIQGYNISSFCVDKVWYKKDEDSAQIDNNDILNAIDNLRKNPKPFVHSKLEWSDDSKCSLIIFPTDYHLNKATLDQETVEQRCVNYYNAVVDSVERAKKLYNIVNVKLILGSDFFHTDGFTSTTTKGTGQDLNMLPHLAFEKGLELTVKCIDYLESKVPTIDIINLPGNHSRATEYFFGKTIEAYYRKYKNITFDVSLDYRKVFTVGNESVMLHHGDNKPELIVQEFANFYPKEFTNKYVSVYSADKHHSLVKDIGRVTFRQFPTLLAGKDRWTTQSGYSSQAKMLSQIIDYNKGRMGEIETKIN